ncbi:response regulator transcription factor [Pedobacter sp. GR22-6]|uniref:response regulator transcription factor n=1 Tax=Pedobacter sp. GR22-6 TaxID=3127957 RepID=UPI00307DE56C
MLNIVIADDHSIVRDGLRTLLEKQGNLNIVAECLNGMEVIELAESGLKIDVVLSDLNMPVLSGMELITALQERFPEIKIVILSMIDDLKTVKETFRKGASAYILKTVDINELIFTLNRVQLGLNYVCTGLIQKLIEETGNSSELAASVQNGFSSRELEILRLIAEGFTNNEISDKLFLSKRTVEGHRQSLLEKTGSRNTATLIRYAVTAGLL